METEIHKGIHSIDEELLKKSTKLCYSICKCSSYSSTYVPEHILNDKPWDQNSRWSSGSNTPPQFLVLRLERISIVEKITFGKLERPHVCNLRKFKIFAGLTEEHMTELIESGLANDSNPETITLSHRINGYIFPCQYIKIVPLQSWGPSFNFSIWFVEINGIDDYEIVQPHMDLFTKFKEREAIRVCLKHLRDHNFIKAFEALKEQTDVKLEDPQMTHLHSLLVTQGDFDAAELFLQDCAASSLFNKFLANQEYQCIWNQLLEETGKSDDSKSFSTLRPKMRGGHQMVLDSDAEQIFLFGGWDGTQELADFWLYSIVQGTWTLLSQNTEVEGGPSARSCHKMVLDPERRQIFTLGRFVDQLLRHSPTEVKNDFYVYEIEEKKWTLITDDTEAYGGPALLLDHQISVDPEKNCLYVFGGRIFPKITANQTPPSFGDEVNANRSAGNDEQEIGVLPDPSLSPSGGAAAAGGSGANGDLGFRRTGGRRSSGFRVRGIPVEETTYSGLYSYHIPTNTWTLLRSDIAVENRTKNTIKSVVGHTMLFHKGLRKLFVFGGHRSKEYLNECFCYDVDTDEIEQLPQVIGGNSASVTPMSGFTQRATIDTTLNEVYIFCGSCKEKDRKDENVQNTFWIYDISRGIWSCVYKSKTKVASVMDGAVASVSSPRPPPEPTPRFAHQLVYDENTKTHYLFGGNPGKTRDPKVRLDDFWTLKLERPGGEDVLRKCKLMLRKQKFIELASRDTLAAVLYLQRGLSELVDHNDPIQSKEFQKLSSLLFSEEGITGKESKDKETIFLLERSKIYDKIVSYFPEEIAQPRVNLIDLLSL